MDPIDHGFALARLEAEYEREYSFYDKRIQQNLDERDRLQSDIDKMITTRDEALVKLASIRSLQATIRPSAVMQ